MSFMEPTPRLLRPPPYVCPACTCTCIPDRVERPLLSEHHRASASPYPTLLATAMDTDELVSTVPSWKARCSRPAGKRAGLESPLFRKLVFRSVVPTSHSPLPTSDVWHQVTRPNERGWRGGDGESERRCTVHMSAWCAHDRPSHKKTPPARTLQ